MSGHILGIPFYNNKQVDQIQLEHYLCNYTCDTYSNIHNMLYMLYSYYTCLTLYQMTKF